MMQKLALLRCFYIDDFPVNLQYSVIFHYEELCFRVERVNLESNAVWPNDSSGLKPGKNYSRL